MNINIKKFFMKSAFNKINAKYGINNDTNMGSDSFDYIIGDDYNSELKVPKDFEVIDYKKGIDDEKYYCEIWIPIKKKQLQFSSWLEK
jgi:predicted transcriptional regulator YdeE